MEAILEKLLVVLSPASLVLLFIVIWQFRTLNEKDSKLYQMMDALKVHTETIQRFLGVLEGRRIL